MDLTVDWKRSSAIVVHPKHDPIDKLIELLGLEENTDYITDAQKRPLGLGRAFKHYYLEQDDE